MGYKVMQIEVSNHCSLACWYCPHPGQQRPKGDMSRAMFGKCMELVSRSDNPQYDGRKFVWINHFGEPLLNPLLPRLVADAAARGIEVSFASNGVDHDRSLFPRSLWQELAAAGLRRVIVSAHVKPAQVLRDHIGDIVHVSGAWEPRRDQMHDWAGQVDLSRLKLPPAPVPDRPCDYQLHDMFAVTWDGRIAACCYDIEGGVGLTVDDVLASGFGFRQIALCAGCRVGRGDAAWL